MMALEEKFDLTLDEEGKCCITHATNACLVLHSTLQVLLSGVTYPDCSATFLVSTAS